MKFYGLLRPTASTWKSLTLTWKSLTLIGKPAAAEPARCCHHTKAATQDLRCEAICRDISRAAAPAFAGVPECSDPHARRVLQSGLPPVVGADVRSDAVWHRGPGSEADDTFPVAGGCGQPAGTTRLCMYTTKMCRHVGLSSGLCNLPPSAIGTVARCVPSQR
jgi:hypothetical protein